MKNEVKPIKHFKIWLFMREQKGKILAHFSLDFWASKFFAYLPETVLRYYYILFDDTMDRSEACFPPSHQLIEELKSARARAPQSTLALFGLLTQCAPKQKLLS